MFAPPADDPLFGYYRCERVRCPRAGESRRARALGLCDPCAKNFYARVSKTESGGEPETLERFKTRPLLRHDQRRGRPGASGQRAGQWRPEAGDGERPSFLDEINLAGAVV